MFSVRCGFAVNKTRIFRVKKHDAFLSRIYKQADRYNFLDTLMLIDVPLWAMVIIIGDLCGQ